MTDLMSVNEAGPWISSWSEVLWLSKFSSSRTASRTDQKFKFIGKSRFRMD
jgi:hypothetical protein